MEGAHSLSNFISQLPRAHVISSLPASPIPDVKSSWGSDPCTTPKGLRLSVRMTQKLHPLGPETQSSRASMCVFKGKELVHMQQRDLWIPPPRPPAHEMLFFQHVGVLILQRPCCYVKGFGGKRGVWGPLWKTTLPTLTFWALGLLNSISPQLLLASLWGFASPSLGVYITWLIPADTFC